MPDFRPKRSTKPVDEAVLDQVHAKLSKISVSLSADPGSKDLRALFAQIRQHRNAVARVLSAYTPVMGRLRAEVIRLKRRIDAEGASVLDTGRGLLGADNVQQRTARMKVVLSDGYDLLAELEAEEALVEEAMSHARLVRDELRSAFEEASRSHASLELEWRITTGGTPP